MTEPSTIMNNNGTVKNDSFDNMLVQATEKILPTTTNETTTSTAPPGGGITATSLGSGLVSPPPPAAASTTKSPIMNPHSHATYIPEALHTTATTPGGGGTSVVTSLSGYAMSPMPILMNNNNLVQQGDNNSSNSVANANANHHHNHSGSENSLQVHDASDYMSTSLTVNGEDEEAVVAAADDEDEEEPPSMENGGGIIFVGTTTGTMDDEDEELTQTDNDTIKAVETGSTHESDDIEEATDDGNPVIKDNHDDLMTNFTNQTSASTRIRRASRPWWLICIALVVVAFAAVVATIVALGMLEDSNTTSNNSAMSDPSSPLVEVVITVTENPTESPTTEMPTADPTTGMPNTLAPTINPTDQPSANPTITVAPSEAPTVSPVPTMAPTLAPSEAPSTSPTMGPTQLPSANPTDQPSALPTESPTSAAPTVSAAPTQATHMILSTLLENRTDTPWASLMDTSTPQGRAVTWMATEDTRTWQLLAQVNDAFVLDTTAEVDNTITIGSVTLENTPAPTLSAMDPEEATYQLQQRFAIVTIEIALHGNTNAQVTNNNGLVWSFPRDNVHECDWPGIECNSPNDPLAITGIHWPRQELRGYVAPEISLLTSLEKLDLADNGLTGFVDAVWGATSLEKVYLHDNQFEGPIGDGIGSMTNLKHLYLGRNQLTGSIPEVLFENLDDLRTYCELSFIGIAFWLMVVYFAHRCSFHHSRVLIDYKPITVYLILNYNQLTGTLPSRIRNSDLYYLDLSHNQLTGELPRQLILPNLRHFHMDHNTFVGSIPEDYADLGSNRLLQFYLNDNQLTGNFPGGWHRNLPHKFLSKCRYMCSRIFF